MSEYSGDRPQVSRDDFRSAAGRFATGVTVVTARDRDELYGVTVSSFASLSLNPLLVTVSINQVSPLLGLVERSGSFAVSLLASDQAHVSRYFSSRSRGLAVGAFPDVATEARVTGAPVVSGSLGHFDCRLDRFLPGGDHRILVGRVVSAGGGDGRPLVYWRGDYRDLPVEADEPGAARDLDQLTDSLAVQLHLLNVSAEEMLDAQLAVEPTLAGLAAANADPEQLEELERLVERGQALAAEPQQFQAEAVAFHAALARASGNRPLQASLLALGRLQTAHYAGLGEEQVAVAVEEHRQIAAAVAGRDAEAARALMAAHLAGVRRGLRARTA